ncbi:hypothetical protein PQX77_020914 [Marasmius sp. AFHP31]|nr:hypothetical protein PQX77_020914 [Marasmius sp. AFHP31]
MVENSTKNTLEYAEPLYHAVAEDHCGDFEVGMGPEESLERYMPRSPLVDEGCKSTALPGELVTPLTKATPARDEQQVYELYVDSLNRWSPKCPSGVRKHMFRICGNQAGPFCGNLKVDVATFGEDPGVTDFGLMETQAVLG